MVGFNGTDTKVDPAGSETTTMVCLDKAAVCERALSL